MRPPHLRSLLGRSLLLESRDLPSSIHVNSALDTVAVDGQVTLREAILAVNAQQTVGDAFVNTFNPSVRTDTIMFDMSRSYSIAVTSPLPAVTRQVRIFTVSLSPGHVVGTRGFDYGPRQVELNGAGAGPGADGLVLLNHTGSTVEGLAINRFGGAGVRVVGGGSHTLIHNFIGTDRAGVAGLGNGAGVVVDAPAGQTVTGVRVGDRGGDGNVITGNVGDGVVLAAGSGHRVAGNLIGLTDDTARGTGDPSDPRWTERPPGNGGAGIVVRPASSGNQIGGPAKYRDTGGRGGVQDSGLANHIGGNAVGVLLEGPGNAVVGNLIGGSGEGATAVDFNSPIENRRLFMRYESDARANRGPGVRVAVHVPGPRNRLGGDEGTFAADLAAAGRPSNLDPAGAFGQEAVDYSANTIAFNGGAGIELDANLADAAYPVLMPNHIDFNAGPGIAAPTPSQVALTSITSAAEGNQFFTYLTGTVTGSPGRRLRVDVFSTQFPDPSGEGEGGTHYGTAFVTVPASGRAAVKVTTPRGVGATEFLSGVVTDVDTGRVGRFGPARTVAVSDWSPTSNPESPAPRLGGPLAVGAGAGGGPVVAAINLGGGGRRDAQVFEPGFTGGVRVATADFTGDGVPDVAAGSGPGRLAQVVILDGRTLQEIKRIDAFEGFVGGVFVASGDLNGDGTPDLVITPDEGGGPRVRVFSGKGFGQLADFLGINDPAFRGGARPGVGDVTGDGAADLLVAAGFGGGPRLAAFDGRKVTAEGGLDGQTPERWETWKPFGDFFLFEPGLRNGVYVTAGDLDGDGFAEVVAGAGPDGGPRVYALSGRGLTEGRRDQAANFFAGPDTSRGGVRVAVADADGDGRADLLTGAGAGDPGRVNAYLGSSIPPDGDPGQKQEFKPFGDLPGGLFVG